MTWISELLMVEIAWFGTIVNGESSLFITTLPAQRKKNMMPVLLNNQKITIQLITTTNNLIDVNLDKKSLGGFF